MELLNLYIRKYVCVVCCPNLYCMEKGRKEIGGLCIANSQVILFHPCRVLVWSCM